MTVFLLITILTENLSDIQYFSAQQKIIQHIKRTVLDYPKVKPLQNKLQKSYQNTLQEDFTSSAIIYHIIVTKNLMLK
jgi:hypothetical protein